ncbi:hypothetical protein KAU33_08640 [Candidatus Dependentiae bacterium]|nr:hypothetical protein [Candidatus Dependentiae bacterium]
MKKPKKLLFTLIFYVLIILFIVVVDMIMVKFISKGFNQGEGISFYSNSGVKVIDSGNDLKLLLSPICVYKNYPNQKGKYRINSLGFRGGEIEKEKRKDKIRIVCIGGSSIFGWSITDEGKTIPRLLEMKDEKLEVINAGVLGYTSAQELGLFIEDIYELNPDIVICYNLWNDLFFSLQSGEEYRGVNNVYNGIEILLEEDIKYREQVVPGLMIFMRNLFFKTNLGKGRKVYLDDNKMLNELDRINNEIETDFNDLRIKESLKLYKKNMRIILNITRVEGIEFLVVLQPEINTKRNQTKAEWDCQQLPFPSYLEHFSPIFKCAVIDLEKYFKEANINYININAEEEFVGSRDTLFMDFIHTNEKGNDIVAEIIYDYLKQSIK